MRESGSRLHLTVEKYPAIIRLLHWSIAAAMIGLIALGWYMVDMSYYDRWYQDAILTHKAVGILVLVLAAVMLAWKFLKGSPGFVATIKQWEQHAATVTHSVLYGLMIVLPVTGYLISTSAGDPVRLFSWFDIPVLYKVNEAQREIVIALHYYLAYGGLILIAVHAAAALKHQFIDKDGTLGRML